jgi:hypothetical protein
MNTTKVPFAYSYGDYDGIYVLPTLAAVAAKLKAAGASAHYYHQEITVTEHYTDGTEQGVSLKAFIDECEVDMAEVERVVDQAIEEDKKRQAEFFKNIKGPVTGSPWLCDMSREYLIEQEALRRRYVWKDDIRTQ